MGTSAGNGVFATSTAARKPALEVAGRGGHQGQWDRPGAGGCVLAATLPCWGQFGAVQGSSGRVMAAADTDGLGAGRTLRPQVTGQALRQGVMACRSHSAFGQMGEFPGFGVR